MSVKRVQPRAQAHHHIQQPQQQGHQVFIDTLTAAQRVGYVVDPTDPESASRARHAFRMWARRRGLTVLNRGRRLVISWLDVQAELRRRAVAS